MDERCVRVFEHRERDGVLVRLDESSGLDLVVGPFVALLAFRYSTEPPPGAENRLSVSSRGREDRVVR